METLRQKGEVKELLIMSRDSMAQLQALLEAGPAQELAGKILRSLDGALSVVMGTPCSPPDSDEVTVVGTLSSGERSCVDSGESGKRPRPAVKDRRGGYKRRTTSNVRVQISTTMEDGYAWRKYGQKVILNAEYPRCYYRCTHKPDQGCLATKQVQIIAEGPLKYQTTYFGNHTCSNITVKPSNSVIDSSPQDPHLISFEPKNSSTLSERNCDSTTSIGISIPLIKEEVKKEIPRDSTDDIGLTFWPDEAIAYDEGVIHDFSTSYFGDFGTEFLMDYVNFDNAFSC